MLVVLLFVVAAALLLGSCGNDSGSDGGRDIPATPAEETNGESSI